MLSVRSGPGSRAQEDCNQRLHGSRRRGHVARRMGLRRTHQTEQARMMLPQPARFELVTTPMMDDGCSTSPSMRTATTSGPPKHSKCFTPQLSRRLVGTVQDDQRALDCMPAVSFWRLPRFKLFTHHHTSRLGLNVPPDFVYSLAKLGVIQPVSLLLGQAASTNLAQEID